MGECACFSPVDATLMAAGNIGEHVQALLRRGVPPSLPAPTGADEAATIISDLV